MESFSICTLIQEFGFPLHGFSLIFTASHFFLINYFFDRQITIVLKCVWHSFTLSIIKLKCPLLSCLLVILSWIQNLCFLLCKCEQLRILTFLLISQSNITNLIFIACYYVSISQFTEHHKNHLDFMIFKKQYLVT